MAALNAIAISVASKVASISSSSPVKDELESVRGCFFWLLIVCTAIAAIGVVLETAEDWFPVGKPILDMNTGIFMPSSFTRWRKAVVNLGWKLVILGVVGEGIFEVGTSGADEMLQNFTRTLLAITTDEAGSAAKSAKIAHDEADAVKGIANQAREDAKDALAKAQIAQRELAHAEADAAKAQAVAANALTSATDASTRAGKAETSLGKAETEAKDAESSASNALTVAQEARHDAASFESDLIRLKKQAADRDLDEYKQSDVALKIAVFLGSPYELETVDTSEAENLLVGLDAALSSAGWIYRPSEDKAFRFVGHLRNGRQFDIVHGGRGVEIGLTKALQARFKPAADKLVKTLNAEEIVAFVATLPDNDPSPNNIHIIVGAKP
jgi:hypothetical protein